MAYDKDQNDFPLPSNPNENPSSANFLPRYFRTDVNKKFIGSTLDQMTTPGVVEKVNAFAGRRYARSASANDIYLPDVSSDRENYQFEPSVVYKDNLDNVLFYKNYNDYIGQLNNFKGSTSNHSLLNSQEFYSWNPNIDWDKFVNFREYYWLPTGPYPVAVIGNLRTIESTISVSLVQDDDNFAYIFSTRGPTRNPTLRLFKGQTYFFEINAPGHPMTFATSRNFLDIDQGLDIDLVNYNVIYNKGITKYVYNEEGLLTETTDEYIEQGVIKWTISDDVPQSLYYVSQNDINTSGIVLSFTIEEANEIDLNENVLGKKTFKTGTGLDLSNGMKVYFPGTVVPEKYATGFWYVEGVGESIKLIAESDLEVPVSFTTDIEIGWDEYAFDAVPFEDASSYPGTKDYIVINRASADRNPWTRYNRWFHADVITKSAEVANQAITLDQDARAKRPIIEFNAGLKLYKHGSKAKQNVNLIDTFTKDAFSTIEGSLGYNIDGIDIVDGMRVLFAADTDILVNGRIYTVKFITHNGRRQVSLIATDDSEPALNDCVLITQGNDYKGKMFYYDGTAWKSSQDKTQVNQPPLFDLFDKDGNPLDDSVNYPSSNFTGNKVFSYKVGTGSNDVELGFPLTYKSIANVGDIVFENNLVNEVIEYQSEIKELLTVNSDVTFIKKYDAEGVDFVYENNWKKANSLSQQAVIQQVKVSNQKNNFPINVFDNSRSLTDLVVKVYVNDKNILKSNYTIENINGFATVIFNTDLQTNDLLVFRCFSSANKNSNGFYEVPINLEKNPLNENIVQFTLGEVNDHVDSMVQDLPNFAGTYPGSSNLRDLGNTTSFGRRFVKHSGPLSLAMYHITDRTANAVKAIKYNRKEYAKFKRRFINLSSESGFEGDTKNHVDLIIEKITKDTLSDRSFYFSDMVGHGAVKLTTHDVEYTGPAYFALSESFDLETLSTRSVLVYRNRQQLLHNKDYTFNDNFVYVTLDLQVGDIIDVYEYNSTCGSNIPPTPTKLGLYPKYEPIILKDTTSNIVEKFQSSSNPNAGLQSFTLRDVHPLVRNSEIKVFLRDPDAINFIEQVSNFFTVTTIGNSRVVSFTSSIIPSSEVEIRYPAVMIQGHDGSLTRSFNDYRDEMILELEYRIFNNIKCSYDATKLDIHEFVGSVDRNTGFNKNDIDKILLPDFTQWLDIAGSLNYSDNSNYSQNNGFTFNYSYLSNKNNVPLKGSWRKVYKDYLDTDRPHTHPWEMLGFPIKPTWWETVYGPAPYTRDNLILWTDLSEGIIRQPGKPVLRNKKYQRSSLLESIPVDEEGNLLDPYAAGLAQNFDYISAGSNWIFGDQSPVETAWRRSSEYPFSLITAWTLLQPAKLFGIGFDISRIERNNANVLVYNDTQKIIELENLIFPSISTNEDLVLTSGIVNFISNYMSHKNVSLYENYKTQLKGLKSQLSLHLGGFADKNKLKLVLDSRSPLNKTSVFVPDENILLFLNSSSPIDTATFSGIIIEKTFNGYLISGYDKENPEFEFNVPIVRQGDKSITIGGVSEAFVDWAEDKQYVAGSVVRYNFDFYRVKITHQSGTSFDTSKFAKLAELPIVGGVNAIIRKNFENASSYLAYGTTLRTLQDVVDFLLGYENSLKKKGFKFEFYNNSTEQVENMLLCVKEFMFWTTQNWDVGTVLTLSPAANRIEFEKPYVVVDDIFDNFYDNTLLTGEGIKLTKDFSNIFRDNSNKFGIRPIEENDGIYLTKLPLIQKEHVILIDNSTVFNDTIYDVPTGYRQERIKLVGYRTDNWNGGLNIPGFVYDEAKVTEWQTYYDYAIGDLVKFKEFYYSSNEKHTSSNLFESDKWVQLSEKPSSQLYPNWDYKAVQFTDFYDLDTDNFDVEQQRLGQHLIGYQPREYLANIITDSVSQYKFYQGFIQDKGTKNSLTKLFDALSSVDKESLEFYEEWALRLGQYGAVDNITEIEYELAEEKYRLEPQLFELVESTTNRTDLVYEISSDKVYLKPEIYSNNPFSANADASVYATDNGYVSDETVQLISVTRDGILTTSINNLRIGDFVWVINERNSWDVWRHITYPNKIIGYEENIADTPQFDDNGNLLNGIRLIFENYSDIQKDDIIGIYGGDSRLEGFWKVYSVELNKVAINTVDTLFTNRDFETFPDSSQASVSRFVTRRFGDANDLNDNIQNLRDTFNDTVWIDNTGSGSWGVYSNDNIFKLQEEIYNPSGNADDFGISFAANDANTVLAISSLGLNEGTVRTYFRPSESSEWQGIEELSPVIDSDKNIGYGFDIAMSTNSKWLAVGAPLASNIKTNFRGDLQPGVVYNTGDIIRDRGTLWKANKTITSWEDSLGDSSTIVDSANDMPQDWDPVNLLESDVSASYTTGFPTQGLVYVYEKNSLTGSYELKHRIMSPFPRARERFGYKVEFRSTLQGYQRLFIGAPGVDNEDIGRIYFLDNDGGDWKYSVDRKYKGVYADRFKYNVDDLVYYNGKLYTAVLSIPDPGSAVPGISSKWEEINDNLTEYTGYIPRINFIENENENQLTDDGKNIGKKFDVNKLGDIIIISARGDFQLIENPSVTDRISVYRNALGRWKLTTYIDSTDSADDFGYRFAINDVGDKIAIGAPLNDSEGIDQGAVHIYKQLTVNNEQTYQYHQTIRSPFREKNEAFGNGLDYNGNKLVVSGKNTDKRSYTTFDRYTDYDVTVPVAREPISNNLIYSDYVLDETSKETGVVTTFDGGRTTFVKVTKDTGRLALFQEIGDYMVYAEDIDYDRNTIHNDITNFTLNANHIYLGLPKLNPAIAEDSSIIDDEDSSVGVLVDIRSDKNANSWEPISSESGKVDLSKVSRLFLYSKTTNDIIQTLDVIDPRQGKIAGPAEQEISFKTFYDPAIYSVAQPDQEGAPLPNVTIDQGSNWTESYVGTLWWNLNNTSWYNPYQGTSQYRSINWHKQTISSSVDVYEWVGSFLTPQEYGEIADTNEGLKQGISGVPLYGDYIYSAKIVVDPIANSQKTKFYFWVKNSKIVPPVKNRRLSAYEVEELIRDPSGQGYRYVEIYDTNKFGIHNCKSLITANDTVLHFTLKDNPKLNSNIHTEYQLLTQGLATDRINSVIEEKWFDSLIGYDKNLNPVPDPKLSPKQKYGILNFPRQSMFVNKTEAVKQFVERVNSSLAKYQIVDNYDLSLLQVDEPAPSESSNTYDQKVSTVDQLRFVGVAKAETAILTPVIENAKIVNVEIVNPGRSYKKPPTIKIVDQHGSGAVLKTQINNLGQITSVYVRSKGKNYSNNTTLEVRPITVLVENDAEINGRWALYEWNKTTQLWNRKQIQSYVTSQFWNYKDWYAEGYNSLTVVDQTVDFSYQLFALDNEIGDIVRINNVGSGGWLLLKKIDDQLIEDYTVNYETIGRQNGTIELSDRLYDYTKLSFGYDTAIYDTVFYDREPIVELKNILTALRDSIYIGDLAAEYNELFFASVRYALSEQTSLDWVFKTSFVRAKHNLGTLAQKVTYQNDNLENYQDYVNEVKPYSSKVREYISSYNQVEPTNSLITDFDVPPSYSDQRTIETIAAKYNNNQITDIVEKYLQYPYRSWVENNAYDILRIEIVDGGSGWLETPTVVVSGDQGTVAKAYIRKGVVYAVDVINPGSKVYTAPTVTFSGTQTESGTPAKAVAIIGNAKARSVHMVLKFDRVSGNYLFTDLNKTASFVGTGSKTKFQLIWPIDIRKDTYTVTVNGIKQLTSDFTVGNDLDTSKGYDRYLGYIEFANAPATDAEIEITFKMNVSMLSAADRILHYYNPTASMPGKDLPQLMDGVEYTGATYTSIGFGTDQGFDIGGFGSLPFDTFDNVFEDEIFVLDGSTTTFDLSKPLENNVEYNVYIKYSTGTKYVRLDDPLYDGVTELDNEFAIMLPIIGDGVTTTVSLDQDKINTNAGDTVIIRKSTSDGSFTPSETSYDTALTGGNLAYTTATGIAAEDITVDGDGFVTPTTSKGPEEMVPGQVLDTLDIRVYHKTSDGTGIIATKNYKIDGSTTVFELPTLPQANDSIIVKLDNQIIDSSRYTVDWQTQTLTFEDSTVPLDSDLAITCIGTNGTELLDTDYTLFDGSTYSFVTGANYSQEVTAFVTINGVVQTAGINYLIERSTEEDEYSNKVKLVFNPDALVSGDHIQWTLYDSVIKTFSQVIIDNTFEADGVKDYHTFTGDIPVPFNNRPIAHNILVFKNKLLLSPGYTIKHTGTTSLVYDIEDWQFADPTTIDSAEIIVYINDRQLAKTEFSYDPVNCRIILTRTDLVEIGDEVKIYVIKDADYYFLDTLIEFFQDDSTQPDLDTVISAGDEITLQSLADSSLYTATVVSVENNNVVIRSYRSDIRAAYLADNNFTLNIDGTTVTTIKISDIEYVRSDNLTFKVAPSSGEEIEIYQFSNHDVNNFQRSVYEIISRTTIAENTPEYYKRNLLTKGYVYLRSTPSEVQYVWVALNGELLTPNADYIINSRYNAIELNRSVKDTDRIDLIEFGNSPIQKRFGFRIFKDMLNRTHYKRLNQDNSYTLKEPLNYYDSAIRLNGTKGIFKPNKAKNIPGVIFIEGERIEYFQVKGDSLLQLRRGTLGTGVKNQYAAGTVAYGQGPEETIEYNDTFLIQNIIADGSSTATEYTLNFTPSNANEIEVFVGGRRLRKTALQVYDSSIAQDSPEADVTVPPEFTVVGNNIILSTVPAEGQQIKIVRKIGKTWNESGKSLAESNNAISRFLRKATIQLPK